MARPSTADTLSDIVLWHLRRLGLPIADSALKDGLMQLSPTAAHISHSGVQLTAPQMSTRSDEHHTVR
jgi:hypothetical protein